MSLKLLMAVNRWFKVRFEEREFLSFELCVSNVLSFTNLNCHVTNKLKYCSGSNNDVLTFDNYNVIVYQFCISFSI